MNTDNQWIRDYDYIMHSYGEVDFVKDIIKGIHNKKPRFQKRAYKRVIHELRKRWRWTKNHHIIWSRKAAIKRETARLMELFGNQTL